jgi:MraZ protein
MFRGISTINLDEKGRLTIPTRYREQLTDLTTTVVVTIDTQDQCLLLYTIEEWEHIEKKIEQLPALDHSARRVQRLLIGHATELEVDNNFRLLLPPELRAYANLAKQIKLVGQGRKFEIWDSEVWDNKRLEWLQAASEQGPLSVALQEISL